MSQTRQTSGLTTSTSHYTSSRTTTSPSIKALQLEYSKLQKEPVEGFTVKLDDDSNLYKWHGKIFFQRKTSIFSLF
jgi:ubiquitin-protein ligase